MHVYRLCFSMHTACDDMEQGVRWAKTEDIRHSHPPDSINKKCERGRFGGGGIMSTSNSHLATIHRSQYSGDRECENKEVLDG